MGWVVVVVEEWLTSEVHRLFRCFPKCHKIEFNFSVMMYLASCRKEKVSKYLKYPAVAAMYSTSVCLHSVSRNEFHLPLYSLPLLRCRPPHFTHFWLATKQTSVTLQGSSSSCQDHELYLAIEDPKTGRNGYCKNAH